MSYTQDQNFVFLNGVKNQIRIAPNRDHPNAGLILRMAHVGKAAELRGDLANASDNLAGRYWIVLLDVGENGIKLRQRGLGELDLHAWRYLAKTASTS